MAFNGSGVHNRVHDWTQDLTNTIPVTASRMDAEHDDISTALSNTICRDGQSTTSARIPFASGTSAAAGTTAAVAYGQANDLNTGLYFPATDQWGLVAGGTATLTGTATGVAGAAIATQANQETGTDASVLVTSGRQHFHQSAAKGWIKCNASGTDVASYNVSGIADGGVGIATVSWGADFSIEHYNLNSALIISSGIRIPTFSSQGTGSATLGSYNIVGSLADPDFFFAAGFGDHA